MARRNYTTLLWHGWQTILMFGLLGLVLALIVTFIQPLHYSSTVRLMVLQNVGSSVDAYTASRSEERIAENLATLIYTTTFFDQVMDAGFSIDESLFNKDEYKRRRDWIKTIDATVSRGTGLMTITAYDKDVKQAEQIVQAVSYVLTEYVDQYTSGGNIEVILIDEPLNSKWPVKPNILANIFSGFILGGFVGVGYIFLQAERMRRRHQLVHREY
ncbi:hypothetical protein A2332_01110 [Candidatus Uhrbacteria bacterium RIFOXYB2_FULL_41_18]|nr:MAG: Chain length determinant protein [Candidatus Uhrbacteria bacterium GW2011_GWF2_40_263]OGL97302.1 MAG: hypothetical protein A2332_01110 [Candidatus Uhrbacteria bacterium RIFOXYB2_FULL_41_18]